MNGTLRFVLTMSNERAIPLRSQKNSKEK